MKKYIYRLHYWSDESTSIVSAVVVATDENDAHVRAARYDSNGRWFNARINQIARAPRALNCQILALEKL